MKTSPTQRELIPKDMRLEEMREAIKTIDALLKQPHPGLSTWHLFMSQNMEKIISIWNELESHE